MQAVTIEYAAAHLDELIDAATNGEQIVLMRGSKHVATIVPITGADLEPTTLSDAQAARFWRELERERASGSMKELATHAGDAGVRRSDVQKMAPHADRGAAVRSPKR